MAYIIAEIGNNHEGNISWAKRAIVEAKACGADAVKFQAYLPKNLVNINARPDRVATLDKICLPLSCYEELYNFAHSLKVDFGVSFFDIETVQALSKFDFAKIASSDCDNFALLGAVAKKYKKIFVSTGTLSNAGVLELQEIINSHEAEITVMHCVSQYPTEIKNASLNLIRKLMELFPRVGYSDHTDSLEVNLMALAMGVQVFEKHFTLDKSLTGIKDHMLSSDPIEFLEYCSSIKKFEVAGGTHDFDKRPEYVNNDYLELKQSYYLNKDIKKGEIIKISNLVYQRPRTLNSFLVFPEDKIVIANSDLRKNQPLSVDQVSIDAQLNKHLDYI